jgi:very-short-patch-repair endonuclease
MLRAREGVTATLRGVTGVHGRLMSDIDGSLTAVTAPVLVTLVGMRTSPHRPPQLAGKIFRGTHAVRTGMLTKNDLRNRRWRRLFRDVYADARLANSHARRCRAAAYYLLPGPAAIAGRSAACLYGISLIPDDEPVEVVVPRAARFGPVDGLRVHLCGLADEDVQLLDGTRVTTPPRTCWDLAQWRDPADAVAYLDRMLARSLVTREGLVAYARRHAGQRGWRRLLRAVDLADPAAESPQESRLRVRLILAGLPKPVSQHTIETTDGRFAGRVDLAWPDLRVAVEYDGRWHADPDQLDRDRARLNRLLISDGWIILHATARRLREDFDGLVDEVRTAMRRQRRHRRP